MNRLAKLAWLLVLLALVAGCHSRKMKKVKEGPTEVVSAEELYKRGVAELAEGNNGTARKYFDQVSLREDAGPYKDLAAIGVADSYFYEDSVDDWTEAISRYQTFLAFHPTHPSAPHCQYRLAELYMKETLAPDRDSDAARNARQSLQAVIENYPNSAEAQLARTKLKEVSDILAAHEIKVGDWYLKKGHPRGAVERYRTVLQEYPDYWNLPLLHYRLGEGLYRDNNPGEAVLYFRKVADEAPGTDLARQAEKRLGRIEKGEAALSKRGKAEKLESEPLVKPKKDKHWWQFWK